VNFVHLKGRRINKQMFKTLYAVLDSYNNVFYDFNVDRYHYEHFGDNLIPQLTPSKEYAERITSDAPDFRKLFEVKLQEIKL
jgi:prolyl oligopeptidase PreP (S9A serine peptidase family)